VALIQFYKSIRSVMGNPHIDRRRGLLKHLEWQGRKVLNLFPVELTLSQSRILGAHKGCGVSALVNSQGLYDYNNMKLLQLVLRDGGVFFDVGANIGSYSLIASEEPKGRVFAFEPHPKTFNALKRNIDVNRRTNVWAFNLALGDLDGELFLTDGNSAENHLVSTGVSGSLPVRCVRGETFCAEQGVVPNFLKIDVEGFEYEVLAGLAGCLSAVNLLVIEMNGLSDRRSRGAGAIHRLLSENGFRGPLYCDFDARILSPDRTVNREDALYFSPSFLQTLSDRFKELR